MSLYATVLMAVPQVGAAGMAWLWVCAVVAFVGVLWPETSPKMRRLLMATGLAAALASAIIVVDWLPGWWVVCCAWL